MMKVTAVLVALVAGANAHTLFSKLYVDGQDQGNGTCIRQPSFPSNATSPIASLASTDMACGYNGMNGVAHVCTVSDKSTLTFEYREWPNDASKGSIDISHKGPCAVYLKKVESAIADTAAGDGWFKIWNEGYDETAGKWCTEKLITNNGHLSVTIPEGLQGGYYLVRPELLALHQADKTPSDPQFYVGCAQVFLESTGTSLPKDTVTIPGYVEAGQSPVSFDIWTVPLALPYPMPGPAIYSPSVGGASKIVAQNTDTQTEGRWPAGCVLYNANWCGVELNQYTTSIGCWNASKVCWAQCTTCYDSAPPTGSINCPIWEAKCMTLNDACNALDYNGLPDYMKQLTPAVQSVSLPAAVAAQTGDGSYIFATVSGVASASSVATVSSSYNAPSASSTTEISSTSTSSAGLSVSTDGSCGGGVTCQDSIFGNCCSSYGYCGATTKYCDTGCNADFGTCGNALKPRSNVHKYGMCGPDGYTCVGSPFGPCCGPFGTCGGSAGACGYGCQEEYGICDDGVNAMGKQQKRDVDSSKVAMAVEVEHGYERSAAPMESQLPEPAHHQSKPTVQQRKRILVSTDGSCGSNGATCEGSAFGSCCSRYNACGSSIGYCGYGCQFDYGMCDIGINGRRNNHLSHNAMRLGHRHKPTMAKVGAKEVVMN